jgi:hypothetical protein
MYVGGLATGNWLTEISNSLYLNLFKIRNPSRKTGMDYFIQFQIKFIFREGRQQPIFQGLQFYRLTISFHFLA